MKREAVHGWATVVHAAALLGALGAMPASAPAKEPPAVRQANPCTILLDGNQPAKTHHCELALGDPPAKLIVKHWFIDGPHGSDLSSLASTTLAGGRVLLGNRKTDEWAGWFLDRAKLPADRFFRGIVPLDNYIQHDLTLNPDAGKTVHWPPDGRPLPAYDLSTLKKARDSALKWARAWKAYRGGEFVYVKPVRKPLTASDSSVERWRMIEGLLQKQGL